MVEVAAAPKATIVVDEVMAIAFAAFLNTHDMRATSLFLSDTSLMASMSADCFHASIMTKTSSAPMARMM